MGAIGKFFGGIFRRTGRVIVKVWHWMTPWINSASRLIAKEIGPIGKSIITNVIATIAKTDLKDDDARHKAIEEIKENFKISKIKASNLAINLAIEMAVTALKDR